MFKNIEIKIFIGYATVITHSGMLGCMFIKGGVKYRDGFSTIVYAGPYPYIIKDKIR